MAFRKITHGIADIRFSDGENSMFCQCGWDVTVEKVEDLNLAFQDHRAENGQVRVYGFTSMVGNHDNEFQREQHQGDAFSISGFSSQRTYGGWV